MIKEGYPEAVIRKMMWKKQSTKMFDYYLKLADTDVQKAVLAKAGVVQEPEKVAQTKPIKCVCGHSNEPTLNYCGRCGRALKEGYKSMNEEISEADRELLKLLKNPKIVEKLQRLAEE
jgi:integrase/recombinase XerD